MSVTEYGIMCIGYNIQSVQFANVFKTS